MDNTARLFTKAISWQITGLIVMLFIGFLFTGSIAVGGGIAVVGACAGFVCYLLHEMAWARVKWGRGVAQGSGPRPIS